MPGSGVVDPCVSSFWLTFGSGFPSPEVKLLALLSAGNVAPVSDGVSVEGFRSGDAGDAGDLEDVTEVVEVLCLPSKASNVSDPLGI